MVSHFLGPESKHITSVTIRGEVREDLPAKISFRPFLITDDGNVEWMDRIEFVFYTHRKVCKTAYLVFSIRMPC